MTKRVPYFSTRKPKSKVVSRYLKFIEVQKNPKTIRNLIQHSPDPVIKGICNCALNACHGDVPLSPKQKQLFTRNRKLLAHLTDKKKSIKSKRVILNQKGGAILIPLLISAVLSALARRCSAVRNECIQEDVTRCRRGARPPQAEAANRVQPGITLDGFSQG